MNSSLVESAVIVNAAPPSTSHSFNVKNLLAMKTEGTALHSAADPGFSSMIPEYADTGAHGGGYPVLQDGMLSTEFAPPGGLYGMESSYYQQQVYIRCAYSIYLQLHCMLGVCTDIRVLYNSVQCTCRIYLCMTVINSYANECIIYLFASELISVMGNR